MNPVRKLYAKIKLRFAATEDILDALYVMEVSTAADVTSEMRKEPKLLLAAELIRRGELFWEN